MNSDLERGKSLTIKILGIPLARIAHDPPLGNNRSDYCILSQILHNSLALNLLHAE